MREKEQRNALGMGGAGRVSPHLCSVNAMVLARQALKKTMVSHAGELLKRRVPWPPLLHFTHGETEDQTSGVQHTVSRAVCNPRQVQVGNNALVKALQSPACELCSLRKVTHP